MVNLQEFKISHSKIDNYIDFQGIKLGVSKNLNYAFLNIFQKDPFGSKVFNTVNKLVNDGRIVPGLLTNKTLKFLKYKFSSDPYSKHLKNIAGLYTEKENMIIFFMDNNVGLFKRGNDQNLITLAIHELMHMSFHNKPTQFIEVFKDQLGKYYQFLFSVLLNLSDDRNAIKIKNPFDNIVKKIMAFEKKGDWSLGSIEKLVNSFKNIAFEENDDIEKKEIERRWNTVSGFMAKFIFLATKDFNSFYSKISGEFGGVIQLLYQSYNAAFGFKRFTNLAFQELFCVSEVISIYSEYVRNNDIVKSVNLLKSI